MWQRSFTPTLAVALMALVPLSAGASPDAGYLGVRMQSIEGGLAEALDLEENSGVLLGQVIEDSPADKAGLQSGDIVTAVGGKKVETPAALQRLIRKHEAGDEVELVYRRDGAEGRAVVTLGEFEPSRAGPRRHVRVRDLRIGRDHGFLGVVTQPLSGDLGEYFGVEGGAGALVSEIVEGSPAEELGLKPGDVITAIEGKKVEDPGDLRRIVGDYEEETEVEVVWTRDKRRRTGKTTLEIREGSDLSWAVPHGFQLEPLGRHVRDGMAWLRSEEVQEQIDEALAEVREQLEDLRTEIEELREESKAD